MQLDTPFYIINRFQLVIKVLNGFVELLDSSFTIIIQVALGQCTFWFPYSFLNTSEDSNNRYEIEVLASFTSG
jgi:hypothetical protein